MTKQFITKNLEALEALFKKTALVGFVLFFYYIVSIGILKIFDLDQGQNLKQLSGMPGMIIISAFLAFIVAYVSFALLTSGFFILIFVLLYITITPHRSAIFPQASRIAIKYLIAILSILILQYFCNILTNTST